MAKAREPMVRSERGDVGLRARLGQEARRISKQHRQLDSFYEVVADAIGNDRPEQARTAFQRLHDALDAHFTLEENVHFPALHGLRPEFSAELDALEAEHGGFRAQLAEVEILLDQQALHRAGPTLDRFVTALAAHEGREEQLLARCQRGPSGSSI